MLRMPKQMSFLILVSCSTSPAGNLSVTSPLVSNRRYDGEWICCASKTPLGSLPLCCWLRLRCALPLRDPSSRDAGLRMIPQRRDHFASSMVPTKLPCGVSSR